jgi:uncharacterized OsmC-like protein
MTRARPISRTPRKRSSEVAERQAPLRRAYEQKSAEAVIVDRGRTLGRDLADPLHTSAVPGEEYAVEAVEIAVGTHRGVGGHHDAPNPGELLCATLAACQDSTIRMVADLLGVQLSSLAVQVEGDVDLRGCLAVDQSVRVGFQSMQCRTQLGVPPGTDSRTVQLLLAAAERSCVVLDTLRHGVDVETGLEIVKA